MIKLPGKKTLYLSLLVLIVAVLGVGTGAAWHYYWKDRVSYPSKIVKHANDLQERIISFDSHITVPWISAPKAPRRTRTLIASSTWSRPVAAGCPAPP